MDKEMMRIVLEHLRAIHADLDEMTAMFDSADHRLAHIEISIAKMRRERARNAGKIVHLGVRVDTLGKDIDRIKRHLDMID